MTQREKELFKSLCSFKSQFFDEKLLDAATPEVLGQLFFNRMQAVAYGTLKKHDLLGKVNREFRNSLKAAYDQNCEKNISFFQCVETLNKILSNCGCKFAMLKGAHLCKLYPEAYRTSNDVDLLVLPDDITNITSVLDQMGFRQGNILNGEFVPATRKEIIESKMMRGETVPYIREVDLPGMRYLEVDINFSLDYKYGDVWILEELLERAGVRSVNGLDVTTLDHEDFFVHLCAHLYKEATTLPWVEMRRDMTLYKYCDIYLLLNDIDEEATRKLFERAEEVGMRSICAFAIYQTARLLDFKNNFATKYAEEILKAEPDFVHTVISPKEKKIYAYEDKDIFSRFFVVNRKSLLKEMKM